MKNDHLQSSLVFHLMSMEFWVRDRIRPPVKILQEVGVASGMTILDFGCGPGGFSLAAAQLVGPKGLVYAVDRHPAAVKMVQKAANKKQLNNLQTIFGSNLVNISESSVDIVLLYDILHDLSQPNLILMELRRVLKPNGILSVSDHHMKEIPILSNITNDNLFRLVGRNRWTYQFEKTDFCETSS